MLVVNELLQSLRNGRSNEREPPRNRSRQSKVAPFARRDDCALAGPALLVARESQAHSNRVEQIVAD